MTKFGNSRSLDGKREVPIFIVADFLDVIVETRHCEDSERQRIRSQRLIIPAHVPFGLLISHQNKRFAVSANRSVETNECTFGNQAHNAS